MSVVRLDDGRRVFVKRRRAAPEGFFEAEARGLDWLAEAGSVRVPRVVGVDSGSISLDYVEPGSPTARGADELGRELADLHATGATAFGAPWPGFIGDLAMDNRPPTRTPERWAAFYAERRVLPYLRRAVDDGSIDAADALVIERVVEGIATRWGTSVDEPPSRIHGDLWSGNVVWDRGGSAWLIDPAAHGGHRETDLAMLALFGLPHLERVLAAYDEHRPLSEGWRDRVGLHQLHPLLVHAVLFGPAYGRQATAVARAAG